MLRPVALGGNCASNPSAPERGKWPISRAVRLVRLVLISSSLDQNVPSIKVTSAETANFCHSELSPESEVAMKSSEWQKLAVSADVTLIRSEEHTSELQSPDHLVCRLLLE